MNWIKRNWELFALAATVIVGVVVLLGLGYVNAYVLTAHAQKPEACTIQILVGAHKDVEVTVPCVKRADVIEVLSTFFGRGDEEAKKEIGKALSDGGDVTLRITSKSELARSTGARGKSDPNVPK